jgi:hypothetical protein
MAHYKAEYKTMSDLYTAYPYDPENYPASMQDYLEAKFAAGWELVSVSGTSPFWFVFRANAQ